MITLLRTWLAGWFEPRLRLPDTTTEAPASLSADLHVDCLTHGELIGLLWSALADAHPEPRARNQAVAIVVDIVTDGDAAVDLEESIRLAQAQRSLLDARIALMLRRKQAGELADEIEANRETIQTFLIRDFQTAQEDQIFGKALSGRLSDAISLYRDDLRHYRNHGTWPTVVDAQAVS